MKWDEAVRKSPVGKAYRKKADGKLMVVDAERRLMTELSDREMVRRDSRPVTKFDDWVPIPHFGETHPFEANGEPKTPQHTAHGLQIIESLKEFNDQLEQKGYPETIKGLQKLGRVHDVGTIHVEIGDQKSDHAITALAILATRWLNQGHEQNAQVVTELLLNYMQ